MVVNGQLACFNNPTNESPWQPHPHCTFNALYEQPLIHWRHRQVRRHAGHWQHGTVVEYGGWGELQVDTTSAHLRQTPPGLTLALIGRWFSKGFSWGNLCFKYYWIRYTCTWNCLLHNLKYLLNNPQNLRVDECMYAYVSDTYNQSRVTDEASVVAVVRQVDGDGVGATEVLQQVVRTQPRVRVCAAAGADQNHESGHKCTNKNTQNHKCLKSRQHT